MFMDNKTLISVRLDPEHMRFVNIVMKEFGISQTAAVKLLISSGAEWLDRKEIIRARDIPFLDD